MLPIIIDGDNLVKRSIRASALDDLKVRGGPGPGMGTKIIYTGGVYATLTQLSAMLQNFTTQGLQPGPLIIVFDDGVPEFRKRLIPTYKTKRLKKREFLPPGQMEKCMEQMPLAREMCGYLGAVVVSESGWEADDIMAAASRWLASKKIEHIVASSDRDLLQVVRWGSVVWRLHEKDIVAEDNFEEVTGVPVGHYLLLRTLIGDTSDDAPGVVGCGEKSAPQLVKLVNPAHSPYKQLQDLKRLLQEVEKPKKFQTAVIEQYKSANDQMRAIDLGNTPTGYKQERVRRLLLSQPSAFDPAALQSFCKRLEFKSVLADPMRFRAPFAMAARQTENFRKIR
jgi:5'-3' exonuclease